MTDKSAPYKYGWNDFLDGKGWDDNPWTECSDFGSEWCDGYMDAEELADTVGIDQVERAE